MSVNKSLSNVYTIIFMILLLIKIMIIGNYFYNFVIDQNDDQFKIIVMHFIMDKNNDLLKITFMILLLVKITIDLLKNYFHDFIIDQDNNSFKICCYAFYC